MAIYNRQGEGVINQLSIDADDVLIDPYTNNPIYEFEYKYILNQDLSKVSTGICVAPNADTYFEFDIVNRLNEPMLDGNIEDDFFFDGIKIDILNKNAGLVFDDFATGFINTLEFTQEDNISKFGSFQKDFGIKSEVKDVGDGVTPKIHTSEFYVYRNPLYINKVTVSDANKTYLNPSPIGFNSIYYPIVEDSSYLTPISIADNFFYVPKYTFTVDNKKITFYLKIVFAKQKQESIKITWGDTTESIAFFYNGNTFNGNGVTTMTNTSTSDSTFLDNSITEIDGKTYEFILTHDYISNTPTDYNLSLQYDDNSTSQYEELKSYKSYIPSAYTSIGNGIISSSENTEGKINFKVKFLNSSNFTSFQKVSIYAKQDSTVSISPSDFIKDATLFSPDADDNYSFDVTPEEIELNKDYWFYLVPYSEIGTGFAWKVGPYQMNQPIAETRADIVGKMMSLEGLIFSSVSEIKEGELSNFDESVIDEIEIGADILCCEYFASVVSNNKDVCSSKIIITNNFENVDPLKKQYYITEYAISDNSFIDYSLQQGSDRFLLKAKINQNINSISPSANYVVHKNCLRKIQE